MAVKLMKKSIELDPNANKWLLAAAIDRDLMYNNLPQIYGTQYAKDENNKWILYKLDSTKVTDSERMEYGVETLAQQKRRVVEMNKKKLFELYKSLGSTDELLQNMKDMIVKVYDSDYDLSESGINTFGYYLISANKLEEALAIFKFNTENYPNGFNTWDSLGECYKLLDKKEEAIKAYKKSIELNPNNQGAKDMIKKMQDE